MKLDKAIVFKWSKSINQDPWSNVLKSRHYVKQSPIIKQGVSVKSAIEDRRTESRYSHQTGTWRDENQVKLDRKRNYCKWLGEGGNLPCVPGRKKRRRQLDLYFEIEIVESQIKLKQNQTMQFYWKQYLEMKWKKYYIVITQSDI